MQPTPPALTGEGVPPRHPDAPWRAEEGGGRQGWRAAPPRYSTVCNGGTLASGRSRVTRMCIQKRGTVRSVCSTNHPHRPPLRALPPGVSLGDGGGSRAPNSQPCLGGLERDGSLGDALFAGSLEKRRRPPHSRKGGGEGDPALLGARGTAGHKRRASAFACTRQ